MPQVHGAGWGLNRSSHEPGAPPSFWLAPTILHELGHVLGLTHSARAADVMSAYYVPDRVTLSEHDLARVRALYRGADGGGAAAAELIPPPPPPTSQREYMSIHKERIEDAMTSAVRTAVEQRAAKPLTFIAERLLERDATSAE